MIRDSLVYKGSNYLLEYEDVGDFSLLPRDKVTQHLGVCFVGDKIVIGYGGKETKGWGLMGGTIEKEETIEETLTREIKEEANMKLLRSAPIGYQKVIDPDGKFVYQLRSCCKVEPYGPFVADPDRSVTEIKLIDPREYRKYFDWREIGERIIQRAMALVKTL